MASRPAPSELVQVGSQDPDTPLSGFRLGSVAASTDRPRLPTRQSEWPSLPEPPRCVFAQDSIVARFVLGPKRCRPDVQLSSKPSHRIPRRRTPSRPGRVDVWPRWIHPPSPLETMTGSPSRVSIQADVWALAAQRDRISFGADRAAPPVLRPGAGEPHGSEIPRLCTCLESICNPSLWSLRMSRIPKVTTVRHSRASIPACVCPTPSRSGSVARRRLRRDGPERAQRLEGSLRFCQAHDSANTRESRAFGAQITHGCAGPAVTRSRNPVNRGAADVRAGCVEEARAGASGRPER